MLYGHVGAVQGVGVKCLVQQGLRETIDGQLLLSCKTRLAAAPASPSGDPIASALAWIKNAAATWNDVGELDEGLFNSYAHR